MNKAVNILLSILLLFITHPYSYACWDDSDDDWYDDWYDFWDYDNLDDCTLSVELDEVVCIGSYSTDINDIYIDNQDSDYSFGLDDVVCVGSSSNNENDDWDSGENDWEYEDDDYLGNSSEPKKEVEDKQDFPKTLSDLLDNMSKVNKLIGERIDKLRSEGRIKVCSIYNGKELKNPIYNPENHTIYLPNNPGKYSDTDIMHELIHDVQNELLILDYDKSSSNNEFQAYLTNWMYNAIVYENEYAVNMPIGMSDEEMQQMFVELIIHTGNCNESYWYDEYLISYMENLDVQDLLNRFCEESEERNYPSGYYEHNNENYEWKWEEILNSLGINKK